MDETPPKPDEIASAEPAVEAHMAALLDLLEYSDGPISRSTYSAVTVHWEDGTGTHTVTSSRRNER